MKNVFIRLHNFIYIIPPCKDRKKNEYKKILRFYISQKHLYTKKSTPTIFYI
ncbi:hypothetical protein HMPREF9018_1374 [Prevotella amnii CRIS 21A-A]|uniref:Uncharacterized protein n=1 Tax=Prevotella amnii CRIS 21A-A TaxID=679191 RepID=E1GXQ9_9BACT|nr:hypothetical protein HMPREF9018_1374 [Prevotella amnii CRIS 21A-A]